MVVEVAPGELGTMDDYWFRWIIDIGTPGPDRGEGGKYLVLPPGYDGPVPEGGFFIARSRTTRLLWFGRSFMENKSDPKPVAELIPMSPAATALALPNSSAARPNSAGLPRRPRP
jgi:hypothetical protein